MRNFKQLHFSVQNNCQCLLINNILIIVNIVLLQLGKYIVGTRRLNLKMKIK